MKPIMALKQRRFELQTEALALAGRIEAMEASETEQARAEAVTKEIAGLDAQIAQVEALRALQQPESTVTLTTPAQVRTEPERFKSLGQQLVAVRNAAYGSVDQRLMPLNAAILGGNESVGSEGGFLVDAAFSSEIEKKIWSEDAFAPRARPANIPAGANSMTYRGRSEDSRANGSRYGGITGYRVAEGQTITASGAQKWYEYTLKPKKYAALAYLTDEVMSDATSLQQELEEGCTAELSFMLNDDMLNGLGVAGCLGVLNHACLIQAAAEVGQDADTVTWKNILEMWNRRWPSGSYTWFINQEVEQQLDQLYHAAGLGALPPRFIDYGPDGTLRIKGRPVVVTEYNAALGDLGDILLADWSQYRLGRIGGVKYATSMSVAFLTDQAAFRWTIRADGQPIWKSALTPYKATASRTVSPFVALAAR